MKLEGQKIIGNRIILKPISSADTLDIIKWRNNPNVKCNFIFREDFTVEMHEKWLKTKVASGEVVQYIIIIRDNLKHIGSVYFRDIDSVNKSAEFGIFIGDKDSRGHGFGLETTTLFTEFGFDNLKLHRIFLRVLEKNKIALSSYENAGFKREGLFRDMVCLDGDYNNVIFMSKIKGLD